jgi:hypothetical protein
LKTCAANSATEPGGHGNEKAGFPRLFFSNGDSITVGKRDCAELKKRMPAVILYDGRHPFAYGCSTARS